MRFEAGELLSETVKLTRKNLTRALVAFAIVTVPGMLIDFYSDQPMQLNSFLGLVALFLQFWITAAVLQDMNLRSPQGGGFGSVFVVSLLTTIAIAIGLLLLIIPGIYLLCRWSVSVPITVGEGKGATSAIEESWRRTNGKAWTIFAVLAVIYAPALALYFIGAVLAPDSLMLQSFLGNVVLNASFILGWHAAIVFHLATTEGYATLEEVFA